MLWFTHRQLKSKDVATRRKAAEELCEGASPHALNALQTALGDEDAEVRRLAATALGKLEDERCREPLLGALRDRDAEVVKAAVVALKRLMDEHVQAALVPLLRFGDAGVRGHAAKTLESCGWRPTRTEEETWLLVAKGQFARVAPYGAAAVPALAAALEGSASSVGVGIIEALGQISDATVMPPLLRGLRSRDPAVCVAAVTALTRLGRPQSIQPIVELLRHQNAQVRAVAAESLGRLRAMQAVKALCAQLNDPVWEVRREVVEALGRLGDPEAVEALARLLADGDEDVREAAAMALGNLGDARAIRPLVLTLKDSASSVRRLATAALSRIDTEWSSTPEARAAMDELKSSLQDQDADVRYFVGHLLASLGATVPEAAAVPVPDKEEGSPLASKRRKLAVSLFIAILCDPDRDLRQAAAEALGRLGDDRAQAPLLRAQNDPDLAVRAAAVAAAESLIGLVRR